MKQMIVFAILWIVPALANAGDCKTDKDCKGDRVCYKGSCLNESVAAKYEQEDFEKARAQSTPVPPSVPAPTSTPVSNIATTSSTTSIPAPETSAASTTTQTTQPVPAQEFVVVQAQVQTASNAELDYARVKAALPEFSHEEDFFTYGRLLNAGRIQGSFIDYKLYRANKRRKGAVAMTAIGTFFFAERPFDDACRCRCGKT